LGGALFRADTFMHREYLSSILLLTFVLASFVINSEAQQIEATNSWLDQRLVKLEPSSNKFAALPRPVPTGESPLSGRCREQIRQPASPSERAVVKMGWTLYGPAQIFGPARIFLAMTGVDGMCRPLGYQAFVYSEGRYAGTLSPTPMNSRTDGALNTIRLTSATRISAEFARYGDTDPLCCPSRISIVSYNLKNDEVPDLTAVNVITSPTSRPEDPSKKNQ
jgi:hypothetical protein